MLSLRLSSPSWGLRNPCYVLITSASQEHWDTKRAKTLLVSASPQRQDSPSATIALASKSTLRKQKETLSTYYVPLRVLFPLSSRLALVFCVQFIHMLFEPKEEVSCPRTVVDFCCITKKVIHLGAFFTFLLPVLLISYDLPI